MEQWVPLFLPFGLLLARVTAFFSALPVFSHRAVPMRVRVALALVMTIFFAKVVPIAPAALRDVQWLAAMILMVREVLTGAGLGLAVALVFMAVAQGGVMLGRQMGMAMASVIDPTSGQRTQPISLLFQMAFLLLFLVSGGHHVLLRIINESYEVFPIGTTPEIGPLLSGIVRAGSAMLAYGLRLVAPMIGAFMLLSVALGIVARAMPELHILMVGFPLRIGLGFFMAAMIMPSLGSFTNELAGWMAKFMGN